jgi:ABC-2 type transport system ATP-binding protein
VVLCTHYLDEADTLSNRIVLMHKGQIIADDTPQNIKARVGKKIIRFRTSLPISEIEHLPNLTKLYEQMGYVYLETNLPELTLKTLLMLDNSLNDLEVNHINLENAFLTLTQN